MRSWGYTGTERLRLNSDVFVYQTDKGPTLLTEDHGDAVMSFVSKRWMNSCLNIIFIYHYLSFKGNIQVRHETSF